MNQEFSTQTTLPKSKLPSQDLSYKLLTPLGYLCHIFPAASHLLDPMEYNRCWLLNKNLSRIKPHTRHLFHAKMNQLPDVNSSFPAPARSCQKGPQHWGYWGLETLFIAYSRAPRFQFICSLRILPKATCAYPLRFMINDIYPPSTIKLMAKCSWEALRTTTNNSSLINGWEKDKPFQVH